MADACHTHLSLYHTPLTNSPYKTLRCLVILFYALITTCQFAIHHLPWPTFIYLAIYISIYSSQTYTFIYYLIWSIHPSVHHWYLYIIYTHILIKYTDTGREKMVQISWLRAAVLVLCILPALVDARIRHYKFDVRSP